ncbi:MAG: DUF3696 domain-containing protein [Gemmatimonadales bacterium]
MLYVEPADSGAIVRELELDEEGRLLDPWPGGFFVTNQLAVSA